IPLFIVFKIKDMKHYQAAVVKPCCAVCKTNSLSMWRNQGEILCSTCTVKSTYSGGSGASASSTIQQNNDQGKQSKQEIHRRSARYSTKYKAPASEKKVINKGKITCTSCDQGVYYQIGDIHGFVQDQGNLDCEKSSLLTCLIPTQYSPQDRFDPRTFILGNLCWCPKDVLKGAGMYSIFGYILLIKE
uniref:GATA zinc finger domain containing 1 n=1 Tax=Cyprinus carpio TaxID=7962 RepID=A0A8C2FT77_CYPCA